MPARLAALLLLAVPLSLAAACGDDGDGGGGSGGTAGSGGSGGTGGGGSGDCDETHCDFGAQGCIQTSGGTEAEARSNCDRLGGTFGTGECADHGDVGGCRQSLGMQGCTITWIASGIDREAARTACEMQSGRTFVDP